MYRRLARALIGVPLVVAVAALASWQLPAGGRHAATWWWSEEDPNFGGFSGIHVTKDGTGFTAVTDKGFWMTGRLHRDGPRLTGVETGPLRPLRGEDGAPLPVPQSDAEGLRLASDGTAFIAFEQRVGIRRYPTMDGVPTRLPNDPFRNLPFNAGLESVALLDGRVVTVPEVPRDDIFTVWIHDPDWTPLFEIPARGIFRISDADIFEGHLYILERAFLGVAFSSRVRRFDLDGGGEVTLLTTRPAKFDNLEGLSVWRDGDETVLTMISDDNFMPFERTELVEYRFTDASVTQR
ncbi:esterase-like activity of phytase family protein [Falsirhodobacter halotolerans]|uniref:esterase-like activity of phytase family protein n=1 Tax=Falsirhodobacter halotolerans TaxID=1146892 RepID=UPI001FD12145|nr:esterase-like activity of phytase family protein [Falsirhodobacter halotolerans]MCJ8138383.1 esterase-like activity of phytase family protein [Falsirhodobacter halotolerans]